MEFLLNPGIGLVVCEFLAFSSSLGDIFIGEFIPITSNFSKINAVENILSPELVKIWAFGGHSSGE